MTTLGLDQRRTAAAFFATPWPWLAHAAAWAAALAAANAAAPLIDLRGPLTLLALVAAVVTARFLGPKQPAFELAEVVRFAFVDALFLSFAGAVLIPVAMAALQLAVPGAWIRMAPGAIGFTTGAFVVQFYVLLWAVGRLRRRSDASRNAVRIAGFIGAVALAWSVGGRVASLLTARADVERAAGAYERETGESSDTVRSEIALSLHGFYGRPETLVVEADERITVVGDFSFYAAHAVHGFARIGRDGTLDRAASRTALDTQGIPGPADVRRLADGALLVAVAQTPAERVSQLVGRTLSPNGALDERPGIPLGRWSSSVYERSVAPIAVAPDGSIVVGENGALDPGAESACVRKFAMDGRQDGEFAAAVAAARDRFAPPGSDRCTVTDVRALPGGEIIVVFTGPDERGEWRDGIIRRLAAEGRFDESFAPAASAHRLAVGERGEVFVAPVSSSSGPRVYTLAKLADDGIPDKSFAPPAGFFASITSLAIDATGKLLVAGGRGDSRELVVVRLTAQGAVDQGFGDRGSVVTNGFVDRIVTTGNGEIYLLGDFVDVGRGPAALPRTGIARLRADGAPDATFDPR